MEGWMNWGMQHSQTLRRLARKIKTAFASIVLDRAFFFFETGFVSVRKFKLWLV